MAEAPEQQTPTDMAPRRRLPAYALYVLIGLVLLAGAAAGFVFAVVRDSEVAQTPQKVIAEYWAWWRGERSSPAGDAVIFIEMPPITTNLRQSAPGRLVQLGLMLKTREADKPRVEAQLPRMRDLLTLYLRTVDAQDIEGTEALIRFKRDIAARIAAADPDRIVSDVLVTQLVMQ